MSILPQSKVEQVQFCESHAPIWAGSAAQIGLTSAQCASFTALTDVARKAFDGAQSAKQAYHAAITAQNVAIGDAVSKAADLIRVIKGFAELTSNPNNVYSIAQIPPSATPVPAAAPGKPNNVTITLESSGAVTLAWDADNAAAGAGAFFEIARKLPGQSTFYTLGGAPGTTTDTRRMSFTDATIPTSAAGQGAQYIITGRRGTLVGIPSDAIVVQFGVDGLTVTGGTLQMAA